MVNLRQHPSGLFSETLDLDLDVYINDTWSIGPSIRYSNDESGGSIYHSFDQLTMKLGVQANYAWDQNIHDSGWLLSSTVFGGYRTVRTGCTNACLTSFPVKEKNWSGGAEVTQLYQFIWGDFFNINLGLGGMMTIGDKETAQLKRLTLGVHPSAEFSIGWRL